MARIRVSLSGGGSGGTLSTSLVNIGTSVNKTLSDLTVGKKYTLVLFCAWTNTSYGNAWVTPTAVSGMKDGVLTELVAPANYKVGSGTIYAFYSAYEFVASDTTAVFSNGRPETNYCFLISD